MNSRSSKGFAAVLALSAIGLANVCLAADAPAAKPAAEKATVVNPGATIANVKAAYVMESCAKARYDACAAKATEEGYKSVAALFRAVSASQDVLVKKHAAMVQRIGGALPDLKPPDGTPVKTTKENLEAALAADLGPKNTRYAGFAKQAETDKMVAAVYGFKGAIAAETEYVKLFKQALAELDAWKAEGKVFAVCQVCAFLVMGPPPEVCPVCKATQEKFAVIK